MHIIFSCRLHLPRIQPLPQPAVTNHTRQCLSMAPEPRGPSAAISGR